MGRTITKYVYLLAGTLSLCVGMIGVLLPVLPTTPFLLLASFCYLRSSTRMYNWLIGHQVFGQYIYCYMKYRAIPGKTKLGALIFLWLTLILSMVVIPGLHIKIFLAVVGIAVTTHIILLKTLSLEEMNAGRAAQIKGNEVIQRSE